MLAVLVLCVAPSDNAPRVNADEGVLVFSVRRWAGEYESRDIPGGVKTTPSTSSIHSIRSDGTDSRKLVAIKKAVCASPVSKWSVGNPESAYRVKHVPLARTRIQHSKGCDSTSENVL